MSCHVGKATEGLENELSSAYSPTFVTSIVYFFCYCSFIINLDSQTCKIINAHKCMISYCNISLEGQHIFGVCNQDLRGRQGFSSADEKDEKRYDSAFGYHRAERIVATGSCFFHRSVQTMLKRDSLGLNTGMLHYKYYCSPRWLRW